MIEELTPEQEALMLVVRGEYIEKIHTYVEPDYDKVEEWVGWLYGLARLDPPKVFFAANHHDANEVIKGLEPVTSTTNAVIQYVRTSLSGNTKPLMKGVIDATAPFITHPMRARYGNYSDLGWVVVQDFYTRIGVLNNEYFNKYKDFLGLGIYDTLQYEGLCVVVKQPLSIKKAHEERLERSQLKNDLVEAGKKLDTFIRKHTTQK